MYSFGLIWWIIPVRNASIMTFEADMGTSAFVRVIEQCCFNCVSKSFNAQAVNFISKPPKVMESRTYVKKPIWNTIETTLLYHSDNSTIPQVWMQRNNFSPLHQRILLPTSSLIKFQLERLKQMASEFLKNSEWNPNEFHSQLVSQVRILSFLEKTASNIIVFCTKNMSFFDF